ncbi:hypothetical protein WHR41_06478 [Cladosporium halotolerans]|uniref:Glycosyltransferase family 31 protein n=1 Tax=Cladosporium halotolerans TaxID=1052096 RepID=A0AB34KN66_9PEZI
MQSADFDLDMRLLSASAIALCAISLSIVWRVISSHRNNAFKEDIAVDDNWIIQRLNLPETFEFHRYRMKVREQEDMRRKGVVLMQKYLDVSTPLATINKSEGNVTLPPSSEQMSAHVPSFRHLNTEETQFLVLGLATKFDDIIPVLNDMRRWLSRTRTRLLILVTDKTCFVREREAVDKVYARAAELEIRVELFPYTVPEETDFTREWGFVDRLFSEAVNEPKAKWVGIIEEETFFVSLPQLMDTLTQFDHTKPLYLGQLSESWSRVTHEGMKACGGAGVFVSVPLLAAALGELDMCNAFEKGLNHVRWRDCIYNITDPRVRLTQVEGLNQLDFRGDLSGWYEAGHEKLLSLHHWKSRHSHPVPAAHMVTDIAGPDSFLERYIWPADRVILTNGYSIVKYPMGVPDIRTPELTMVEDGSTEKAPDWKEFHHSLGSTRPALEIGVEKVSWKFVNAWKDRKGNVRQFYVRYGAGDGEKASVIEIDWVA